MSRSTMIEIQSLEQYNEVIHSYERCLVFFGSEMCSHCQEIKLLVYQLVRKYPSIKFIHVEVTKVHVDNLNGVPIFVGFHQGTAIDKVEGANQKELINLLNIL